MPQMKSARIQDHFADLTDPRRRDVIYPLINVVVIAICAVICGADDFVAIAEFKRDEARGGWRVFSTCEVVFRHTGRFNAILAAIKPAEFEKCLLSLITALHEITAGQVVAIDGKTLRSSFDTASGKAAIHMVSAWATANHISLQDKWSWTRRATRSRPSPKLLQILEISGCLGDYRRRRLANRDCERNRQRAGSRLRLGGQGKPTDVARRDQGRCFDRSPRRRLYAHFQGASAMKRRRRDTVRKRIVLTLSVPYRRICPMVPAGQKLKSHWNYPQRDSTRQASCAHEGSLLHSQQISFGTRLCRGRASNH